MNTKSKLEAKKAIGAEGAGAEPILKCADFQELLFAYMSRELGDAQSLLIREHLRTCDVCRAEAAEIEATLALLKSASSSEAVEEAHLTEERRERMLRAILHPVIDWVDIHHKLMSLILALLALAALLFVLRDFEIFRNEPLEEGIPIWRMFKSGELPELVEKRLREHDAQPEARDVGGQKSEVGDSMAAPK